MSAELAARRTAAAAVLADYRKARAAFLAGGQYPDYAAWALRLAHHLGYVLDSLGGLDGTVTLTAGQAQVVARALADAAGSRREHVQGWCQDCADSPAGACDHCLDELDAAQGYDELAATLGLRSADSGEDAAVCAEPADDGKAWCSLPAGHAGGHRNGGER